MQENEGSRLGSNRLIRYDTSIISATNRNLRELVDAGRFRQDLFYRLFAVEIVIPPLRERREDIAALTVAFVQDVCHQFDKTLSGVSKELISVFERYSWPGNARQLRREVERAVALTPNSEPLTPDRCSTELTTEVKNSDFGDMQDLSLPRHVKELEVKLIETALKRSCGGKEQAARLLGITRQGLHKKLTRYADV